MADENLTRLADPASAIASYLDELLHTATDTARQEEAAPPVVARPAPAPVAKTRVNPLAEAQPAPVAEPEPESVPAAEPAIRQSERLPERALEVVPEAGEQATPEADPERSSSRPDWSEQPFECLIFTVAGLQLAVPLILLGAIHRIEEGIKPIPGSPRWYMGIRADRDHNLRVVDSAEWIMAGRVPANARDNYRFVIRLDNSEWGLACDDVAQSFTLNPEDVRWRTARSKRPWLAGTVVKQMCALIDVRAMADLLVRAEREHHLDLG